MRNDQWLSEKLNHVWATHFSDVPKKNEVRIRFKGCWKNKFGHIRFFRQSRFSEIVINGAFIDERVPELIIDLTIAHELAHYAHGFCSPLRRCFRYPHQGGVVRRELKRRGFGAALKAQRKWAKACWFGLFREIKSELI